MNKLVAAGAAITGLVGAVLVLLPAFGINLTSDQSRAILGLVSAVLAAAGIWFAPPQAVATKVAAKLGKTL